MKEGLNVKFGDICNEVKLNTKNPVVDGYDKYIGLEHLDSGSLKIKRWGNTEEDSPSFTKVFKKGHILFGKRRPYLKKAAIAEFDGICSSDIIVMEPSELIEYREILPFIIQSENFWNWAIQTSSGSLSPRTKFKSLAEFLIPFSSENEKKTKLSILKSLAAVEEKSNLAHNSANKLLRSFLLDNLFPAKENPFKLRRFKTASMPNDYEFHTLKELSVIYSGSTPLRSKHDEYFTEQPGSMNWFKTLDLSEGPLFESEEKITSKALNECSLRILGVNTVLLAMYGGFNQIGRVGILKTEGTTNQAISAIECNTEKLLPDYCVLWLKTFRFLWKRYAASSRKDPNITKLDIENFPIWIPNIDKQKNIIKTYNNITETVTALDNSTKARKEIAFSLING
jgi:type I restriction enzyme S subunit